MRWGKSACDWEEWPVLFDVVEGIAIENRRQAGTQHHVDPVAPVDSPHSGDHVDGDLRVRRCDCLELG